MLRAFAIGLLIAGALSAAYDAGQRSIIRDCVEFHTFTYARGAWACARMRTAGEREREEGSSGEPRDDQRFILKDT
jgi:hypothetical protein